MDLMINRTLTAARLFTTVAIACVAAGCSGDDTSTTSTTGNMNAGGARDSGRDMGRGGGGGGAGGSSPVDMDAASAGGARDSGGDVSSGGGGGSGGSSSVDALAEVGPPQAGTTVLLIDNVFVVRKSLGDAALGTDAAEAGPADGGDLL